MELMKIEEIVKNTLSEKRYIHSIGVAKIAEKLAIRYGEKPEIAKRVGLLHDIAKEMTNEDVYTYCKQNNIVIDEIENAQPSLLHAKIGASIAKEKFGFSEQMCQAIKNHTTGDLQMSLLDKILYVADKVEENRNYPEVEKLRTMAEQNIEESVFYILGMGIHLSIKKGTLIHPKSVELRNQMLLQKVIVREKNETVNGK